MIAIIHTKNERVKECLAYLWRCQAGDIMAGDLGCCREFATGNLSTAMETVESKLGPVEEYIDSVDILGVNFINASPYDREGKGFQGMVKNLSTLPHGENERLNINYRRWSNLIVSIMLAILGEQPPVDYLKITGSYLKYDTHTTGLPWCPVEFDTGLLDDPEFDTLVKKVYRDPGVQAVGGGAIRNIPPEILKSVSMTSFLLQTMRIWSATVVRKGVNDLWRYFAIKSTVHPELRNLRMFVKDLLPTWFYNYGGWSYWGFSSVLLDTVMGKLKLSPEVFLRHGSHLVEEDYSIFINGYETWLNALEDKPSHLETLKSEGLLAIMTPQRGTLPTLCKFDSF